MQIKIQCQCETRYSFEIEPVNGRMPGNVACPTCGADGTDAANSLIQQQLAAAQSPPAGPAPARQPMRIVRAGAGPAAAMAAPADAPGPAAAPSPVEADGARLCSKHGQEPATETCQVCGKPICAKCMEQFGYVCSVYCQSQAEQRNIALPVYAGQKSVVQAKEWRKTKFVAAAIATVVLGLLAAYGWYEFSGCKPRTLYSLKVSKADRPIQSQLLAADQMLLLRAGKLSLIQAGNGKEMWSVTLPAAIPPPAPSPVKGPGSVFAADDFEPPRPQFHVGEDDLWVSTGDRILRLDRKTGKQKSEVPIRDRVREIEFTDASIMVIAGDGAGQISITHIALPSGTTKTETLTAPALGRTPTGRQQARATAGPRALAAPAGTSGDESEDLLRAAKEFFPAGANVIQFKSAILEKRLVAVQAMKAAPAESTLNSSTLSARDSMKAAGEMLNEMQRERTGGVSFENESRYQVTLHRVAPADAPDWTGEVIGPPLLFPLKTVDALVAGKTVHVFNKRNQKLWEGKLSFPVADALAAGYGGDRAICPCLEEAGSLYVFDKGVLSAFDARTGTVAWRVPSVGISQVVRDDSGKLYVVTTSASPESIQYSQQVRLNDKPYPVLLKVDAASGKVLWKADQLGEQCYLSGKYLYVTEARISGLDVFSAGGDESNVPVHHRIYRVDPGTGKYLWQYYQPQAPGHISVQKNRLLLQFGDEIRVLSYLTL